MAAIDYRLSTREQCGDRTDRPTVECTANVRGIGRLMFASARQRQFNAFAEFYNRSCVTSSGVTTVAFDTEWEFGAYARRMACSPPYIVQSHWAQCFTLVENNQHRLALAIGAKKRRRSSSKTVKYE